MDRQVTHSEEYEIWILLSQLSDAMLKARENELVPLGLSAVQVGVMYVIRILNKGGIVATPSEISRWVFREPHTISGSLTRMERQGLVSLMRSTRGPRRVLVQLTEKGEEAYRRQVRQREVIPRILGVLSPEDRRQFRKYLESLREKSLQELTTKLSLP